LLAEFGFFTINLHNPFLLDTPKWKSRVSGCDPNLIRFEPFYEGEILYEKWFKPNEVGITTGDPRFPFRRIQKERIVEVNGEESKFSQQSLSVSEDSEQRTISVKGSTGSLYEVQVGGGRGSSCSCKGYQFRGSCRHITEAESQVAA
jgi:hypothetical protein